MNLPDLIATKGPPGTARAIARASERYGITPSEYCRHALWQALEADDLCPPGLRTIAPRISLTAAAPTRQRAPEAA